MAPGAVGGAESGAGTGVNRVVGLLPGGEVAISIATIGGRDLQIVIVVDVAGRAGNVRVTLGELEAGGAVVESRGIPAHGVVAVRAIGDGERGACGGMRGIVGLLPGGEVAASVAAIRGGDLQVVVIVDVARGAGEVGVAVGQRKAGGAMVKLCAEPGIERMATLAIAGSERGSSTGVIRIGGGLPIFQVARIAVGG